jgi:serine O-acetyltransferase
VDERPYLAEALLERLEADRIRHCALPEGAPGEVVIAVPREALDAVPASLGRFARSLDLQLVYLAREEPGSWRAVLAWSDDVGRPRFLNAEIFGDWQRGGKLLLRSEELLPAAADVRFIRLLLDRVFAGELGEEQGRRLSELWQMDPRGSMEQIARFWSRPSDMRLVAQAAKHGAWYETGRLIESLRKGMRVVLPWHAPGSLALRMLAPPGVAIAFVGGDAERREQLRRAVERDLAPAVPAGLATVAHGFEEEHAGVDLRVVLAKGGAEEDLCIDPALAPDTAAAQAERAILRWLECRVERRHPAALVGRNPPGARLLQLACRLRIPLVTRLVETLFNCDIECLLRSPVLMPHPYGIVIERGTEIGSRVTILQQATLARTERGAPLLEDNVVIGPGARVTGPVRIGRGATVGPNAVVTRDVPSHCTVVGLDQIAGRETPVAIPRLGSEETVVNSGHWLKS